MRSIILFATLPTLAACAEPDAEVRGAAAESLTGRGLYVWVDGDTASRQSLDSAFVFRAAGGVRLALRVGRGTGPGAHMEVELPPGARLTLDRVRIDRRRDLAFPAAVRLRGADVVRVNGLRMAPDDALPGQVDESGVVLATGGREDAFLFRPHRPELPELRVIVADSTPMVVEGTDETLEVRLSAGDSLRLEGNVADGYVHARRIHLPSRVASEAEGDAATGGAVQTGRATSAADRSAPAAERRRSGSAARGDIPAGHAPPPGMCRDWNPDLPPGQQPPPRRC